MSETSEAGQSTPQVEATTGLPEGQIGPVVPQKGFVAEVRRALGRLASSFGDPAEDPKTGWGKGF